MRLAFFSLVSAALLLQAGRGSQPYQGLQRCVAAAAEQVDLSGAVLVSHGGEVVAKVDRGRLSEPGSGPITEDTRFNIGSASKMFTAVAIGQLIEQGKLELDEPIGRVVHGLTPGASAVTIRQLLDHTSGLGDFFKPENMQAMLQARSASDLLPLISTDTPEFPPGSRFSYSNTGFALLGIAIERLSGLTYGEYVRQNISQPAGMTSTGLDPQPLETLAIAMTNMQFGPLSSPERPAHLLHPHADDVKRGTMHSQPVPGGAPVLVAPDGRTMTAATANESGKLRPAPGAQEGFGSAAGGVYSSAKDMDRFAIALESGKLLSPQTVELFTSPQVQITPEKGSEPARYYGFGFGLSNERGRHWVGHNGGTLGANAEIWFDPADRWAVTVLSNRDPPLATQVMRRIRPLLNVQTAVAECTK